MPRPPNVAYNQRVYLNDHVLMPVEALIQPDTDTRGYFHAYIVDLDTIVLVDGECITVETIQ